LRIQACTSCELCNLAYNKKDISKGYGKLYGWIGGRKKCRYMFVGLNPSYNRFPNLEYAFGGPNQNQGAGKEFVSMLKRINFFEEIYCTNLVKCSTTTNDVSYENMQSCFSFFLLELEILCPEKIIAMGKKVFEGLFEFLSEKQIKIPLEFIWHPSYVFSYRRKSEICYQEKIESICKR
jgi:uracil-DNA glycosylase family 4